MVQQRILIVAMMDSVHTARWLEAIAIEQSNVVLFGSGPHRRIHPIIAALVADQPERIKLCGPPPVVSVLLWLVDVTLRLGLRRRWLRHVIQRIRPTVIHAMETQHAGYVTTDALVGLTTGARFVLSIWGSDVYWFSRFAIHRSKIRGVLGCVDLLVAECQRDLDIAAQLGYRGPVKRFLSLTGGVSPADVGRSFSAPPPHRRRGICIKGYSGFMGQAPMALRAAVAAVRTSNEWEITVYAASVRTWLTGAWLRWRHHVKIRIYRKGRLSDDQLAEIFANSRVSIMLSRSDGFPATLKQSLLYGAVPVMAATSCADELVGNHAVDFIVEPEVSSVEASVRKLLAAGTELEIQTERNRALLLAAFCYEAFRQCVNETYSEAFDPR